MSPLRQDPIFVVGYPRSGTTLMQGILAAQPGFITIPETHYFSIVERGICDDDDQVKPDSWGIVQARIEEKCGLSGALLDGVLACRRMGTTGTHSKVLFEAILMGLIAEAGIAASLASTLRWVEKTPTHAKFLERIHSFYPGMKAIRMVRHPVPSILSRKNKFPFNRDRGLKDLARHWVDIQMSAEVFRSAHPGLLGDLRYEDVIANPQESIRQLSLHLEMDIDPEGVTTYRRFLGHAIRPDETWKLDDLKKDWRNTNSDYLSETTPETIGTIEEITGPVMSRYGYGSFRTGLEHAAL